MILVCDGDGAIHHDQEDSKRFWIVTRQVIIV